MGKAERHIARMKAKNSSTPTVNGGQDWPRYILVPAVEEGLTDTTHQSGQLAQIVFILILCRYTSTTVTMATHRHTLRDGDKHTGRRIFEK